MTSPLDLIKQGIIDKNIELVAEGYKILTGIDLLNTSTKKSAVKKQPVKKSQPKRTAKKAAVAAKPLNKKTNTIKATEYVMPNYKKGGLSSVSKRRNGEPMQFITGSPDRQELREEQSFAKKISKKGISSDPVPNSGPKRTPFKLVKVKCQECGKTEEIHPIYVRKDYCCKGCGGN